MVYGHPLLTSIMGSVPTLRQVLKPSERPAIWSRYSAPDMPVDAGYNMSLESYYLGENIGWEHKSYCTTQETLSEQLVEGIPEEGVFTESYKLGGYNLLLGVKRLT